MGIEIGVELVVGLTNNLRKIRNERGLTLEQLGEFMQVDHTTISRLERGEMKLTEKYIAKFAEQLQCHPAAIITDIQDVALSPEERDALQIVRGMDKEALQTWLTTGRLMKGRK